MDVEYLKKNVSDALAEGLKEVIEKRPSDPIEFLAYWLIKYRESQLDNQKVMLSNHLIAPTFIHLRKIEFDLVTLLH